MTRHRGYTLLDVVVAMAVMSILSAIALPRAGAFLDSIRVEGAVSDAFAVFSAARHTAVARARQTTVEIDSVKTTMTIRVGTDTVLKRELGTVHDVKVRASRSSITYSAAGIGYGAGNLTLTISRGRALDSLVVSRLGRVRH
jgi:prepilin-type N-terminal cleavage/methylation domain-containing protein